MRGRVVWLVILLALGSGGASPAGRSASLSVVVTALDARSSSAAVSWQTSVPARVVVEIGLDENYGVWSMPPGAARTTGRTLLGGLEPATTYRFRLVARAAGVSAETVGSVTTDPVRPWTSATTTANALFIDEQAFFPRMVWRQCPWAYPASIAAGINLFMGSGCGGAWTQLMGLRGRAYSVIDANERSVEARGLMGWHQPDEADEHVPAGGLTQLPPSAQSHRVSFLTLSNHFFSGSAPLPQGRGMYPSLIARAEMIGFDLYPLQIWCRKSALRAVYDAQRELEVLAAGKPTFQWIEAGHMTQCWGLWPSPAIVRAETWLAIAGGARGIGYFPDNWQPPVAQEIARINRQIAALAPALLSPGIAVDTDPARPVKVGARGYNGATYVIAANSSFEGALGMFKVNGLGTTTARVFGEGRTVPVRNGAIKDWFRGLGVHIYVVPPVIS